MKIKPITYEQALSELQSIVTELQKDAVSIDELAEKVRRAAELVRHCREKLRVTEAELDLIMKPEAGSPGSEGEAQGHQD